MTRLYVGVDPGVGGGLACISENGCLAQPLGNMTLPQIWDWFLIVGSEDTKALIEQVTGYVPRRGRKSDAPAHGGQPGSHMFRFGQVYGQLEAMLVASGIKYRKVTPQVWQRSLGFHSRNGDGTKLSGDERKRGLKKLALRLFPESMDRITLATCDAVLLAECCRRRWENAQDRQAK